MSRKTHSIPRCSIGLKRYSVPVIQTLAMSSKLDMKEVIEKISVELMNHRLITPGNKFRLIELESVFVVERASLGQNEGWKQFKIAEYARDIFKDESTRTGIPVYLIVDHVARVCRNTKLLSKNGKGRLESLIKSFEEERVQLKKNEPIEDYKSANLIERLKIEYPLFEKRMRFDREFAENVKNLWTPDFLEYVAKGAGELSAVNSHIFRCERTGVNLTEWTFPCPSEDRLDGRSMLETCLDECDDLAFWPKKDYEIPEGFKIDSGLQSRIIYGRPYVMILEDAWERGLKRIEEEEASIARGDPQNGKPRDGYSDRLD